MNRFSSKSKVVGAAALVFLCLFLVRPGASRLKSRIISSISRAVARPVDIGAVHLRLLPRPGFDLENLVIYEDPAFGAEPMLRAPEVTAVVRLTSLMRGRLDIARLELSEPSLNLVRRGDGRWNWESLLQRAANAPLAPTAKSKSEPRVGFPYIEATSGRINLKSGQEKKPYALLNADFALWQDSENSWGARLKAEPLRTDMSLSDTGLLRVNGTWQRAARLHDTPLRFSARWERVQLGQLTKLVTGNDKGWRGGLQLDATFNGTPGTLQVGLDAALDDFHRYDITSSDGMRLAAHCDGTFTSSDSMVRNVACKAPSGDGRLTLLGEWGAQDIDLALHVEEVAANSVTQLARRARKDLPADLISTGTVQGSFSVKKNAATGGKVEYQGKGGVRDLRLQSTTTNLEVAAGDVPFALGDRGNSVSKRSLRSDSSPDGPPDQLHIEYGPVALPLGRPAAAQVRGWLAKTGYGMTIRGEGEIAHILRVSSLLAIPSLKTGADGVAQMDLHMTGSWAEAGLDKELRRPELTGKVLLRNVRVPLRGLKKPFEISSAELLLTSQEVRVDRMSAEAADARWSGTLALDRGCGTPAACVIHFNLNTDSMDLTQAAKWLSAPPSERRWYQVLQAPAPAASSFLRELRAAGRVNVGHVRWHGIEATKVDAAINLDSGRLKISELRADLLGGKHRGQWQVDFTELSPAYTGTGELTGISLREAAELMHDEWITGTAAARYRIAGSGADTAAFWQSAEGNLQFDVRDGTLPHVLLRGDEMPPLRMARWQGDLLLRSGNFEIEKSSLTAPDESYEISGTASFGRALDLRLTSSTEGKTHAGGHGFAVTGTFSEPHVSAISSAETKAELKP